MIDLHAHILPGLDDGPRDMAGSLELARAFARTGVTRVAATPHIREDYPFDPSEIRPRVEELNAELTQAGLPLDVVSGGEVALSKLADLDEALLGGLCLGEGSYLLIESPYTHATDLLEHDLFDLQVRGFRPVLAHPERSPCFLADRDRLARLVQRGILCSVTAASMTGSFGRTVRSFTLDLFSAGLVHSVASDAHDAVRRVPDLEEGFRTWEGELPGALQASPWYTTEVPAAILVGAELPPRPHLPSRRRRSLARLLKR